MFRNLCEQRRQVRGDERNFVFLLKQEQRLVIDAEDIPAVDFRAS
jgi:hypothetical protein